MGEDAEDDRVGARSRIRDREDALLGHGDALKERRHGLGGAHTERVPVVLDRVAFVVAADDAEHGLGALLGLRAPEDEQARPHGGQGGEDLGALEGVAAVCGCGRARRRTEENEVVARLGDAEAKDLAGDRVAQDLLAARVAVGDQVAAEADDDLVHVDAQCGAGCRLGQRGLLGGDLGEAQARATELGGNEGRQVSGLAQLLQVLLGVGVGSVRVGGALVDAGEQVRIQEAHRGPLFGGGERGRGRLASWCPSRGGSAWNVPVTQGDLTVTLSGTRGRDVMCLTGRCLASGRPY